MKMEMKLVGNIWSSRLCGFVLLLAILLTACTAPDNSPTEAQIELEPVTFQLNWLHGSQFLGFYVAQSNGYYAEEGLQVNIEPLDDSFNNNLISDRVASGEFEFAIGTIDTKRAQSEGQRLTAIASIYQFSPGAFFARADSGIATPADLAGHSVVVTNESWQELLEALLAREGLSLDDVETVSGGFDITPFLEGEVEVWAGFLTDEVVRARLAGLELVTLPLYEYGMGSSAVVIYTSQAILETNPELAERFLRGSLRGWAWAVENPSEAVDIMLERFPEMAAERDFHLASFEASIPLIVPGGSRLGEINCQDWVDDELFDNLDTTEGLCTTEIFEAAVE